MHIRALDASRAFDLMRLKSTSNWSNLLHRLDLAVVTTCTDLAIAAREHIGWGTFLLY
jgi:hypothetical protein